MRKLGVIGVLSLLFLFVVAAAFSLQSTPTTAGEIKEICDNQIDDDADKLIDCDDPDCVSEPKGTCDEAILDAEPPPTDNKVTLCHFTGSGSNPFVINTVSTSAWDNHTGHHGDCWKFSDGSTGCAP